MARLEPEYKPVPEADEIVLSLVKKYGDRFSHVDPATVACAEIVNKDRSPTCDWYYKIMGVKKPAALFCDKVYIIFWHKNWWDSLDKAHKEMFIAEALLRLPGEPDGSVLPVDLKAVRCLCKAFGIDWMENQDIPSLLDGNLDEKQVF